MTESRAGLEEQVASLLRHLFLILTITLQRNFLIGRRRVGKGRHDVHPIGARLRDPTLRLGRLKDCPFVFMEGKSLYY